MPEKSDPPLLPTELPNAVVNIQDPLTAPDPSGMAALLTAITKGDSFRDMSATKEVSGMLSDLTKAAVSMAQAAASLVKPGSSGSDGGSGGGSAGGSAPTATKPAAAPVTTTKEQQTTPRETWDAIGVIEKQVAKGNISKEVGSKKIEDQLGNMKGSKAVEAPKERQRAILVRLVGWQGTALVGEWTWELSQLVVVPGPASELVFAVLDLNETPRRYEDGRIVANFRHDAVDGANFNFKLEGFILTSPSQVSRGESKIKKVVSFTVPDAVFEKRNVATATLVATWDKWTSTKRKGKDAVSEWKVTGSGEGSGGVEGTVGLIKVLAGIKGSGGGDYGESETISEEQEQEWTFYFYTGGFEENPTVV